MNLTYRGISYTVSPSTLSSPTLRPGTPLSVIFGNYRGARFTVKPNPLPVSQSLMNLRYRGAWYHPVSDCSLQIGIAPV
jgi:hypothetical protein